MDKKIFGFETPEASPGFLLWQTTITWQRLIKKALDPYQISHAQFVILAIVLWFEKTKQAPTQILIARQSKLDKMTISKAMKDLVSIGLIKREEHEKDARAKAIRLTAKGKSLAIKLIPLVENIDEKFFGKIPKKEQSTLIKILNEFTHESV